MNTAQTYEKLALLVPQMNKTVTCQSITDNGNGTYTYACNRTRWAMKGYYVTILGVEYKIISVVYNVSITLEGVSVPAALTFDLFAPYLKHGTVKKVAEELSNTPAKRNRLPLIWLKEVSIERIHFDDLDSVDNEAECQLFFLTEAYNAKWTVNDGDTEAIYPMRCMVAEFVRVISNNQYVAPLTNTGEIRNYNIFGNTQENGAKSNIFNEPLAGCGLKMTIPFLRDCDCCTVSQLDQRPAPGYVLDSDGNILAVLYSNEYYTVVGGGGTVDILDQDENIIDTITAPGEYHVTVLTEIQDTIDGNTSTIIDNLT